MVDNVSVLAMRDTNLQPLPLGTPQDLETRADAFEFYVNDTWRVELGADAEPRVELPVQARAEGKAGSVRVS